MSSKKNILITGANGQLGSEFRDIEKKFPSFNFLFVSKDALSIIDSVSIKKYFQEQTIDYCINCAAYTAVDKAETEKELAIAINATAVANLALVCKAHNTLFFHFSTDYVFNGEASTPYKELDITQPVNFYGQTKLLGEHAAIKNNKDCIIIRTSWVYSTHGNNFVKTMLRLMKEKESIAVVADQYGCPTYTADIVAVVMQIITENKIVAGIYHFCNEGIISWYDFANAVKEISGSKCIIKPINTIAYPTPAARPHYSALDTQKIREKFFLVIPSWRQSLTTCIKLIQA